MNKDLYITLLEGHVDDLEEVTNQSGLTKLLNDRNDELLDDINDLQGDWAVERIVLAKVIKEYDSDLALSDKKRENLREDLDTAGKRLKEMQAENERLRGIIKELKKENYDLRKRLFDLEKQGIGDSESLQIFRAMEAAE